MAWNPPSDTEIEVDKPLKAVDIRRIRDLAESMALGESGSPIVGLTLISDNTLSVTTAVDIDLDYARFTSFEFRFWNIDPSANNNHLQMLTSIDGGATFTANTITLVSSVFSADATRVGLTGELFYKPSLALNQYIGQFISPKISSTFILDTPFGNFTQASQVDAVRFQMSAGSFTTGLIQVFGVK